MATIYSLFLRILLIALCGIVCAGHGDINVVQTQCIASLPSNKSNTHAGAGLQPVPLEPHAGARLLSRASNNTRSHIVHIATAEIGVREATGRNDGPRVEEYLAYTGLGKGHAWCAAFVSWCYGQAGLPAPRNPWSPALFPNARTYWKNTDARTKVGACVPSRASTENSGNSQEFALLRIADIFGIYSSTAKRINHVGLVKETQGKYLVTIEGNSNDRVESRRRHLSTIYALADWVN